MRGFAVTASDLSAVAIERARDEARRRGLTIDFSVGDMRMAHDLHGRPFDAVIACDNAIPHLLSDADLLAALRQLYHCTRPGGGCLITVRDYDREERGTGLIKPYGVRDHGGKRTIIFQVWDFDGDLYDLSMYFIVDEGGDRPTAHIMRTKSYAIGTGRLLDLMRAAGFTRVERLDGRFYQPVLVGTREA